MRKPLKPKQANEIDPIQSRSDDKLPYDCSEIDIREFYPLIEQAWAPIYNDAALDMYAQGHLAPPQT